MNCLQFKTLDQMLDYYVQHEGECAMLFDSEGAVLTTPAPEYKDISNKVHDERCPIYCWRTLKKNRNGVEK